MRRVSGSPLINSQVHQQEQLYREGDKVGLKERFFCWEEPSAEEILEDIAADEEQAEGPLQDGGAPPQSLAQCSAPCGRESQEMPEAMPPPPPPEELPEAQGTQSASARSERSGAASSRLRRSRLGTEGGREEEEGAP